MDDLMELFRQHPDARMYDGPLTIELHNPNVQLTVHRHYSLPRNRVLIFNDGPADAARAIIRLHEGVLLITALPNSFVAALWVIGDAPQKTRHLTLHVGREMLVILPSTPFPPVEYKFSL